MNSLRSRMLLEDAEAALSPRCFDEAWPQPRLEDGLWYISPAGYRYGFGVATSKAAAEWERDRVLRSKAHSARKLIWC